MTPVETHERLDTLGVVDESHGPGIYALEVTVPDGVEAVQRTWLATRDAPLPDAYADQLAAADDVVYVGRSGDVYDRIMDHVRSEVRRASFVAAFGVADIRGVWSDYENTVVAERNRARALADGSTVAYTDGELF